MALGPCLLALSTIAVMLAGGGARRELSCWVMPNAYVMAVPGGRGCPARLNDEIRIVERPDGARLQVKSAADLTDLVSRSVGVLRVGVVREGRLVWLDLPVSDVALSESVARLGSALALAAALMWVPMVVLWRTSSSAAGPLAALCSLTGVVLVTIVAGRHLEPLARGSILAMALVPSVVSHLGFVFPRERGLYRASPRVAVVPYAPLLILLPAGAFAVDRSTLLWPTYVLVLVALTGGAWAMLVLSCAFALRESESSVERARSRSVCIGAVVIPLALSLLVMREVNRPAELATAFLWISALTLPGVIGFAVSRYNLFDPGLDVRWWVGRVVYLLTAGGAVAALVFSTAAIVHPSASLPSLAPVLAASVGCALLIEIVRARALGWLESMFVRNVAVMARLRERFIEEVAELHDEDVVAELVARAVSKAVEPRCGCVFSRTGEEWRPVAPFGDDPPARTSLARHAGSLMGDRRLLHVAAAADQGHEGYAELLNAGVEVAVSIASGGESLGLLLLSARRSGDAYGAADLEFVGTVAAHTAIAIGNARLAAGLLRSERHATTGRIALTVAHDVGKELDWLRRLVHRLPERRIDPVRFERDVGMIRELVEGVSQQLGAFVRMSTAVPVGPPGVARCDEVIEDAIRRAGRIHGALRIVQSLDPAIRSLRCHEHVGRVLANLIDNAVRASPPGEPVHLHATVEGDRIRLLVVDQGCGMSEEVLRDAFQMGFTTRRETGGLGVGLAICREIIDALGGEIELEPNAESGIRVRVSVPAISLAADCE